MTPGVLQASVAVEYGGPAARDAVAAPADTSPLAAAVDGLRLGRPHLSAATPLPLWQILFLSAGAVLFATGFVMVVLGKGGLFAFLLTLPFSMIVLIRCAALWYLVRPAATAQVPPPVLPDTDLPRYSVLVPLYQEGAIAPGLVQAMCAIEYPVEKLEILFITEAHDYDTRAALLSANPPPHMQILVVPPGLPQTKPRALNYAVHFATGALVAVFDAEDVPDPRQLRLAAETFAVAGPDLVCLQARLGIYNSDDSILTRQFSLEYAALFEAILPALERLGLPILLGGTSNHFRRAGLDAAGGWDAYNVTEDADLGIRIARSGQRVAMLSSDTWEEAPPNIVAWRGQRTRWLKGWMQTYLVHMRNPAELVRNLGWWRTFGVQVMLGGMILSALVHPWFYGAAFIQVSRGEPVFSIDGGLWAVCWFNLVAGYGAGIVLGLIVAWRSEGRVPLLSALFVPLYWLAISAACYRALWQLRVRPHYWEKTPHVARPVTSTTVAP